MSDLSLVRSHAPQLFHAPQTLGMLRIGTLKQRILFSELTDTDTSQAIAIAGFPANAYPLHGRIRPYQAFAGGTISAITVQIGDGDPDALMAAISVFTGVSLAQIGADGAEAGIGTAALESAYAPVATFTSTNGNLNTLTSGIVEARILYAQLLDPDVVEALGT